jgi:hypothetical protein
MCLGGSPTPPPMPPMPAPPAPEPIVIVQPPAPTPEPTEALGPSQQGPDMAGGKRGVSARSAFLIKRPGNAKVSPPINTTNYTGLKIGG